MDTGANPELRRLSGAQRRRALRDTAPDPAELASQRARWVADTEAAFLAAGAAPAPTQRPRPRPSALDTRVRRDRWRNELDEVFTDAS